MEREMGLFDIALHFWRTVTHPPVLALILIGSSPILIGVGWVTANRLREYRWRARRGTLIFAGLASGLFLSGVAWGLSVNARGTRYIMLATLHREKVRESEVLMGNPGTSPERRVALRRVANRHAQLYRKYREAWERPWLPVAPDTPRP